MTVAQPDPSASALASQVQDDVDVPTTAAASLGVHPSVPEAHDFSLERYKYILNQVHAVNENVYKFLAIYQAIATATITAALALFVWYRHWNIPPLIARQGVLGLMWLETIAAAFTALLIFIGVLAWLDYRNEECDLTDFAVYPGFRKRPKLGNFFRWYETYIILFIAGSTLFMWFYGLTFVLPHIK